MDTYDLGRGGMQPMAHMNHGSSMHQYHGNHIIPNHGMGAMTDGQTKRDKDAIYGLV